MSWDPQRPARLRAVRRGGRDGDGDARGASGQPTMPTTTNFNPDARRRARSLECPAMRRDAAHL